jgi:hypothetical protein
VDLRALLDRDPAWRPPPEEAARWEALAADPAAPAALAREIRWWRAFAAARARDWAAVTALAEAGLADAFSEREAVRLALLHCLSGRLDEAEHVIAQAVQTVSDELLPRRFADLLEREGLAVPAARFRPVP